MVKVAELWDQLTWLRGRFGLLRTTSWTLTQVGLEVSKVEAIFRNKGGPTVSLKSLLISGAKNEPSGHGEVLLLK